MDWSLGCGFYLILLVWERFGILGIKKKIYLFRDLFYCDFLLGLYCFVDNKDLVFKINNLERIINCEWLVILDCISWD